MASADGSGAIRLGGLTSGFDTEAIIGQLLAREQSQIDDLTEKAEINVAKVETWEDVAEQLKSLAEVVTKLKADGSGSNTLFDDKLVGSSDETVATSSATSAAIVSDYDITVTTLARAHVAYGAQKSSTYTLPVTGNVIINGATIGLTTGDTLEDIASSINSATYLTGEEMTATVIDDRLVLQTKNQGVASTIYGTAAGAPPFNNGVDDPAGILETELGIITAGGLLANEAQTSADSSFSVNGIPITRDTNTISDVITGVTFNMVKAGSATLDVDYNTEEIKNTVTEFVDLFNETRDFIDRTRNAKLNEDDQFGLFFSDSLMRELFNDVRGLTTTGVKMGGSDWDGAPLTQGAGTIGDKQITIDGFTAGAGTLGEGDQFTITGDTTIYTLVADATIAGNQATINLKPPLVTAFADNTTISVATRTLEDIGVGVRTDTVSGVEGILGIVDEGDLDNILATDVPFLKQLFRRNDTVEGSMGIARRLYDWIDNQTQISVFQSTTRSIDDVKIPGIEEQNDRLEDQIERLTARMNSREQVLIRQFSDMENALAQSQSAGGALAGITGQSQG